MELLTPLNNASILELSFKDFVRGKPRDGILSFQPPCYYHFRVKNPLTGLYKIVLLIFCVPVRPGACRALLTSFFQAPKWLPIPKWFTHIFLNRFLESDLWIHDQELLARGPMNSFTGGSTTDTVSGNELKIEEVEASESIIEKSPRLGNLKPLEKKPGYVLLSKISDQGVTSWRNWWKKSGMEGSSVFGAAKKISAMPFSQQVDRYETHAKYCKSCRNALKYATLINQWSPFVSLLPVALGKTWLTKLLGMFVMAVTHVLSKKVIDAINGPRRGQIISAAQMGP